jgi:hypothetical protein
MMATRDFMHCSTSFPTGCLRWRWGAAVLLAGLLGMALGAQAADPAPAVQVERLAGTPSAVWGGGARELDVAVRNRTDRAQTVAVTVQSLQASSATAAEWSAATPWRAVTLAPSQTSLERVAVEFPAVREPASFLVRFARDREVLGVVPVRVYPDTILRGLTNGLGPVLVDGLPADLRAVLTGAGWSLVQSGELSESGERQRLAVLGVGRPMADGLSRARAGLGVIWLQADGDEAPAAGAPADGEGAMAAARAALRHDATDPRRTGPLYYPVRVGKSVVVVLQSGAVSGLARDPDAQLRFARVVRLALGLETLELPTAPGGRPGSSSWDDWNR